MTTAEKLLRETNMNIVEGKEYTAKGVWGIFGAARSITTSLLGEKQWCFSEGKWVTAKVKPGLVDLIGSLRK